MPLAFPIAYGNPDAIEKASEPERVSLLHITRPSTITLGEKVAEVKRKRPAIRSKAMVRSRFIRTRAVVEEVSYSGTLYPNGPAVARSKPVAHKTQDSATSNRPPSGPAASAAGLQSYLVE